MNLRLGLFTTILFSLFPLAAAPDGEALFKLNCSACHMLDQMVVGPSLVEIRTLYNKKPDDFIKWCNKPGKKRPNVIEMPSMVHVGNEGLRAIYDYIMKASAGAKEKKQEKGDPFLASPSHTTRPYVQRIFMPNAGPAAIAVALDQQTSLCWDAGECRFRYAWTGGFIDGFPYWQGNGSKVATIKGSIAYQQEESPLTAVLKGDVKFQGYSLTNGLPTFRYNIGTTAVTERFSPAKTGKGFQQTFTLSPASSLPITITIPAENWLSITSEQGTVQGHVLTIPAASTANFTINFQLP